MTARNDVVPADSGSSVARWRTRIIALVAVAVVLVSLYFVLAAFVPRWWGQRIGDLSQGSIAKGTGWGLTFGILCTAIPLLLLSLMPLVWRRRHGRILAGVAATLAIVAALPNLMTLAIVMGDGNGAHAGERILDVDAPGFRGASLIGAIIAVVVIAAAGFAVGRWRIRRRRSQRQPLPGVPTTN
ncbi:permease [Nocardia uniformis]|uniref:Permease n=1 Tax=Nocardia uniformis TaxID=53432 RepID=A0A849CC46_9NOCA|nr:hypothetical protein [Nocardia uniformis]NNH70541.1 permease [Nocardia uniformis]